MISELDIWFEEQIKILKEDIDAWESLKHVGTPHEGATPHSGRYAYGSGEKPLQHPKDFLDRVRAMKLQGMKETDIAKGLEMNTRQLRAKISNYKIELRAGQRAEALRLSEEGKTPAQIGKELDIPWSTVKRMLAPDYAEKERIRNSIAEQLKAQVEEKKYIDVGAGTAQIMRVSDTRLKNTVALLQEQGYKVNYIRVRQGGTNEETTLTVLSKEDVPWKEINEHKDQIRTVTDIYSEDGGRTFSKIEPPVAVNSKRVQVAYAEDGGLEKDGLIELRRGVPDISLGKANYAQVRIAVANNSDDPNAGTHYMKGMAVYSDNLPDGIDIRYNSHREKGTPLWDNPDPMGETVFKKMKSDPDNPFGATIKDDRGDNPELILCQRHYIGADGQEHQSALNIVNEEGEWRNWSKTLSSQFLSKQTPALAKQQLGKMYDQKEQEYKDIMALTNPTLKKELLESFADDCEASASHLKAASLPGTASHVLIPLTDIKDNEIYAPNYPNGTKVVLIRHPHAGPFEIPELTVNNNVKQGKDIIGRGPDAVGISHKTAMKLSGADFDGDTALVIPNNDHKVRSKPDNEMSKSLRELQDFDDISAYPGYPGMEVISNKSKQLEMGKISNLITDMTLMKATDDELARAVRYSMVIIDAEKHKLNYKQAYIDNDIAGLTAKYHGTNERGQLRGAATIISRAGSEIDIPKRKAGQLITDPVTGKKTRIFFDPKTGEKLYSETGETQTRKRQMTVVDPETGKKKKIDILGENGKPIYDQTDIPKTEKTTRMAVTDDAFKLTSGGSKEHPGTLMEGVYAAHANRLKALARKARLSMLKEKDIQYNPSARKIFSKEVASLDSKLRIAKAAAPLERQAWLLAAKNVELRLRDRPDIKEDPDALKKLKGQALRNARIRVGSTKTRIDITDDEWKAIQSGAITKTKLKEIFRNTDADKLKQRAMPRNWKGMSPNRVATAKRMLKNGHTQAEVAEALGVSVSTLLKAIES